MFTQRLPKPSADLVAGQITWQATTIQAQKQTGAKCANIKAHLTQLAKDGHLG